MSQATPRKFSEKIAILERKQNEEQEQFHNVMRDVRAITNTTSSHTPSAANSPYTAPSSVGSDLNYHPQQQQNNHHQQSSYTVQALQSTTPNNDLCSKLSPEGPHPLTANWNRAGGSLPNVHQMVQQPPPQLGNPSGAGNTYTNNCWPPATWQMPGSAAGIAHTHSSSQQPHTRTRSPGAQHFHPYMSRNGVLGGVRHERMSQGEGQGIVGAAGVHLQPPDPSWSNRARSDPAIHTNTLITMMDPNNFVALGYPNIYASGGGQPPPQWSSAADGPPQMPNSVVPVPMSTATSAPTTAQILPNSPMAFFRSYPLGSNNLPLQPPPMYGMAPPQQIGQPSSSSTPTTAQMCPTNQQVQPPPPFDLAVGSLPNMSFPHMMTMIGQIPQQQQDNANNFTSGSGLMSNTQTMMLNNCHQQMQQQNVGEQHPTAYMNGPSNNIKIAVTSSVFPTTTGQQQQQLTTPLNNFAQSQSAPTSPAAQAIGAEHPLSKQQWPPNRHFSASPDGLEVPNICVTGTDGSLDCFQDLQDLHLDSEMVQMLKEPGSEQVDPACETQLLN